MYVQTLSYKLTLRQLPNYVNDAHFESAIKLGIHERCCDNNLPSFGLTLKKTQFVFRVLEKDVQDIFGYTVGVEEREYV